MKYFIMYFYVILFMFQFCKFVNGEYIFEDGFRKVDKEIKYEVIKCLELYLRMLRMKN